MKKLITLLAILLFATNLYTSDWKLIESISYDDEFRNYVLLSSNIESCYLIRNYNDIDAHNEKPRYSRIYHSTNKGVEWELKKDFKENNEFFYYLPSNAFTFSPEHLILPLEGFGFVGKTPYTNNNERPFYRIGITDDFANTINIGYSDVIRTRAYVLEMRNEHKGFVLGTFSGRPRIHVFSFTEDNWKTADTMRLPENEEFSTFPGIFASYRGENNIVVSTVREEEE
jgi:hypothetical protein